MSSRIILDKEDFADILETLEEPINKHAMHDQSTHGSWARGGNNLDIRDVMKLHKNTDSLKEKVYSAERAISNKNISEESAPVAPTAQGKTREQYDKEYKEYSKAFTNWAVEKSKNIQSKDGEEILDGSPSGVRKYVEKIVQKDWFVEKFGYGSSLPPLKVNTSNANASGRHILRTNLQTGKSENIISINRNHTKDEMTILHEISHLATAQSITEPYEGHGVQFAKNLVYITSKAISEDFGNKLRDSYIAKGVPVGD